MGIGLRIASLGEQRLVITLMTAVQGSGWPPSHYGPNKMQRVSRSLAPDRASRSRARSSTCGCPSSFASRFHRDRRKALALNTKAWQAHFNREGRKSIWYARTHHDRQRDGHIAELSNIAYPFESEMPSSSRSWRLSIRYAEADSIPPVGRGEGHRCMLIPSELLVLNPHEALTKLLQSQPGGANRFHAR